MTGPNAFEKAADWLMPPMASEARQPETPDPLPSVPHTTYTKDQWQQYLQEKLQAHRSGDPKAMLGVQKAVSALNAYEGQAIAPSTGQILGAEAKGVGEIPGQIARGLSQVAQQLGGGHFGEAAKALVHGLGQTAKGTLMLPATALGAAGGLDVPDKDEILQQAKDYGSSAPMAAAMVNPTVGLVKSAPGVAVDALLGKTMGRLAGALKSVPEAAKGAGEAAAGLIDDVGAAAPRPAQTEVDAARAMSDKELQSHPMGKTPPVEQSAASRPGAPEQLSQDIVERERRRAQVPVKVERRSQIIGTGPESMTPADASNVQWIGGHPSVPPFEEDLPPTQAMLDMSLNELKKILKKK